MGDLSPNDFEQDATAARMQNLGNRSHHDRTDLDPVRIGKPEAQNVPRGVPEPPILEKILLPPAIAHLSANGSSRQPSTETG